MSHQFKPGDLAIVIGVRFPECEPNIGKVVTVESGVFQGEVWVSGDIVNRLGDRLDMLMINPRHLMPLSGDFAPEQQKAKEAEPCA